ncbi:hypothetical protein PG990_005657 [Apiospora arundinis]|uniref:Uncharacterized protein n=1 Tax=Apiospora arundinis TaxID=335852 RepID=A0ABR2J802_9PEZI
MGEAAASNDPVGLPLPDPPELVRQIFGVPVTRIPEPDEPLGQNETRSKRRVRIWRAEVNTSSLSCVCSLLTHRNPTLSWCPDCNAPFEGLSYDQFQDGMGLTRPASGRRSIANVWPVVHTSEGKTTHRHRLKARGDGDLFKTNDFKKGGRWFMEKTRLQKLKELFGRRKNRHFMPPEYGDLPGSVTEIEPKYDPSVDPAVLYGPNAPYYDPLLEYTSRRRPPAKLGNSVNKTEMYRALRSSPIHSLSDRPSVSSLLDAWSSSSSGDVDGRTGKKPKLTEASAARLYRAHILLSKTCGNSVI